MRTLALALLALAPQVPPGGDAEALLARADAALARGALEIDFALSRTQTLTWESHLAEGTVRSDPEGDVCRVDVAVRELRGGGSQQVTLWRAGERYLFLDHDARTFAEGDRPVLGALPSRIAEVAAAILPAAPEELLEARIEETVELAGRSCAKVLGRTADGREHVWYLDRADALPRLWETDRDLGEGDRLRQRMTVRAIRRPAEGPDAPALGGYARVEPPAWEDPETRERAADFGVFTSLDSGLEAFRARFNAEKGRVRAVGLFAPT